MTPPAAGRDELPPQLAPGWAAAILAVVTVAFCVNAMTYVASRSPAVVELVLAVALLAVLLALQLWLVRAEVDTGLRSWRGPAVLAAQAALTYGPVVLFEDSWTTLTGLVAGSALLVLPPRAALLAFLAIVLSMVGLEFVLPPPPADVLDVLYNPIALTSVGLAMFVLTQLARLAVDADRVRRDLAATAVAREQVQVAADLHEVLGRSLAALSSGVTRAADLLGRGAAGTGERLAALQGIARRALADVRVVASGYRGQTFDAEVRAAVELLTAAGVAATTDLRHGELSAGAGAALAAALRDGVTDALRHRVERVRIATTRDGSSVVLDLDAGPVRRAATAPLVGSAAPEPDAAARGPLPGTGIRVGRPDLRLLRVAGLVVVGCFTATAVLRAVYFADEWWHAVVTSGAVLAVLLIHLTTVARQRARGAALAAQALLVYVPLLSMPQHWAGMPGFVAATALLVLPAAWAWAVFITAVTVSGIHGLAVTGGATFAVTSSASTVTVGLVVYATVRLAALVANLEGARSELADAAVAAERLRVARDLHDLLGYSLSAVVLKGELALRLVEAAPDRAAAELVGMAQLAGQALADTRAVAAGHRDLSLDEEIASAVAVLEAGSVRTTIAAEHTELPVTVGTVLATVLREAITNVLRHSSATTCDVRLVRAGSTVRLEVLNDGVLVAPGRTGSGIAGLADRVGLLGGALSAARESPDRFRITAELPARRPAELTASPRPGRSGRRRRGCGRSAWSPRS